MNSVDQTVRSVQSDLDLHSSPKKKKKKMCRQQ